MWNKRWQIPRSITEQFRSTENVLNLPNCLTIFRILLVPLVGILLAFENNLMEGDWTFRLTPGRVAALVVVMAGVSDLLDGYYARKWRIESLLGKFLDPLADKLFLLVGLIMLMDLQRVPAWLVILLLCRELLITGLRAVAVGEGIVIAAGTQGKWKQVLQMVGIGFIMWFGEVFGIKAFPLGLVILYAALVISLVSGYIYLSDFLIALNKKRKVPVSNQA